MNYKRLKNLIPIGFLIVAIFGSCRKEQSVATDSGAQINFSTGIVYFDTVFTSVGSTTKRFKIYNPNDKKIVLSRVTLLHGNGSLFRLNVDGTPGKNLSNIEIGPKDSLFVFVEVTINPSLGATPFVVSDSVMFSWNGNTKAVGLVAWGQNAYYIRGSNYYKIGEGAIFGKIASREGHDTTWTKDKPIVIYNYAIVDSASILTIEAGTKVYFHPGAGLLVYRYGTLKVKGTLQDSVVFQGDRLDYAYRDIPGQWDRIWINEGSVNNVINYAVIKNGFIGIQTEPLPYEDGSINIATPKALKLTNTIIKNMTGAGILARIFNITGSNDVISNCSQNCLALTEGGNYDFKQCTFADYYPYANRQTPLLFLNNYLKQTLQNGSTSILPFDLTASFGNCIIYGSLENEVGLDPLGSGNKFDYTFDHCLIRIDPKIDTQTSNYKGIIKNPGIAVFKDPGNGDYTLADGSPAIDSGDASIANMVPFDIKGRSRTSNPDMGAYEK